MHDTKSVIHFRNSCFSLPSLTGNGNIAGVTSELLNTSASYDHDAHTSSYNTENESEKVY